MSNEKMSADEVLAVLQDDMKAASVRRSDLYGLEGATEALHRSWAAHDAVAALIAERDALREDAERYRWLRKFSSNSAYADRSTPTLHHGVLFHSGWAIRLDEKIDAARAERCDADQS